jgi:acyl phosphate:glycerol-3-phosphate acyltransferase
MTDLVVKVVLAYLLGSIVGSLLLGKLRGVDIRTQGSGNAGGTNALRTQGKAFALGTVLIDIGKGWLAAAWLPGVAIPGIAPAAAVAPWTPVACALAAVIGHVWPLWHGFRGGKGAATFVGALLGLNPWLLVPVLATWLVLVVLFGFVGLASIAAAVALPVYVLARWGVNEAELLTFAAVVAVVVAFAHRGNISRMLAGTEPRARKLWLLGRRAG